MGAGLAVLWMSLGDRGYRLQPRGGLPLPLSAAAAIAGYPLGRALMRDPSPGPPREGAGAETVVLAGVVAPAEEIIWGRIVEPALGPWVTAVLYAAKHVGVDSRWRRAPGLALFWLGLSGVRARSPCAAGALHVALNAGGVVLGHRVRADQY